MDTCTVSFAGTARIAITAIMSRKKFIAPQCLRPHAAYNNVMCAFPTRLTGFGLHNGRGSCTSSWMQRSTLCCLGTWPAVLEALKGFETFSKGSAPATQVAYQNSMVQHGNLRSSSLAHCIKYQAAKLHPDHCERFQNNAIIARKVLFILVWRSICSWDMGLMSPPGRTAVHGHNDFSSRSHRRRAVLRNRYSSSGSITRVLLMQVAEVFLFWKTPDALVGKN